MELSGTLIAGGRVGDLPNIPSLLLVVGLVVFGFEDLGLELQKLSE